MFSKISMIEKADFCLFLLVCGKKKKEKACLFFLTGCFFVPVAVEAQTDAACFRFAAGVIVSSSWQQRAGAGADVQGCCALDGPWIAI